MTSGTEELATATAIDGIASGLVQSVASAVSELVGTGIEARTRRAHLVDCRTLIRDLSGPHSLLRGEFQNGESVHFLVPAREARTLAGHILSLPEEAIAERRQQAVLEDDDRQVLDQLGKGMFEGSQAEPGAGRAESATFVDHVEVQSGPVPESMGTASLVGAPFELTIGEHEPAEAWLLLHPKTVERWIGSIDDIPNAEMLRAEEEIEAAEIRGKLTAYLSDQNIMTCLKLSCRRVGLEIERRPVADVPNPSEHRNGIVLIDAPVGDNRRFEWCKRLKAYNEHVRVALLLHQPSRSRVLQGFLAKADVILGWPISERELSDRLDALLTPSEPETEPEA